jgi:hypothetical protein
MTSRLSLIEFAVQFANVTVSALRPGDRLNLIEDFEAIFTVGPSVEGQAEEGTFDERATGGIVPVPSPWNGLRDLQDADLEEIQSEVRQLLRAAALSQLRNTGHRRFGSNLRAESTAYALSFRGSVRFYMGPRGHELFLYDEPKGAFLLTLILTLNQMTTIPVGICAEDQRLFYRVRRQLYCSRRCVLRANKRAWRTRKNNAGPKKGRRRK